MKVEARRLSEPIYEISMHLTPSEMREVYSGLVHYTPTGKWPGYQAFYYALLDAVSRHKHDA